MTTQPPMVPMVTIQKKIVARLCGDMVMLEFSCGDPYEASVFYEDVVDRLNNGEKLMISLVQPK